MAFTLRLWFSGLCHFVENRAVDDELSLIQLCVLLPDARNAQVPHSASISLPTRSNRLDGTFRMEFDKSRKPIFDFTSASRVEFQFTHVAGWPKPEDTVFRCDDSLTVKMEDLAGNYADDGLDVVSPKRIEGILAQIVLDQGICKDAEGGAVRGIWHLPNAVTGDGTGTLEVEVSEPKLVEVSQLVSARMVIWNLEDPSQEPVTEDFAGDNDEDFDLLISNRCEDGRLALQKRYADDGKSFQLVQLDEDFVEHYKVLHPVSLQSLSRHRGVLEERWPNGLPYLVPERVILEVFVSDEVFPNARQQLDQLRFWVELNSEGEPTIVFLDDNGMRGAAKRLGDLAPDDPERREHEWLKEVREFLVDAVSSGSGCDCLPCRGRSRYLDFPAEAVGDASFSSKSMPSQKADRSAVSDPATGKRLVRMGGTSTVAAGTAPALGLRVAEEKATASPAKAGLGSGSRRAPIPPKGWLRRAGAAGAPEGGKEST